VSHKLGDREGVDALLSQPGPKSMRYTLSYSPYGMIYNVSQRGRWGGYPEGAGFIGTQEYINGADL